MTENIVTGKKYRILTNATSDIWDRISFWTRASDVAFNDNATLEASKSTLGHTMLKRSKAYSVGHIAYTDAAPSWVMLRCTTAGTTAATQPTTYGTISSVGTVITDGTAKFTVYDARPNATLSSSAYQIPTMSLVNNLNSELTANGKQFYFDYRGGKYGYNTSSNRAAATFVPFGGSSIDKVYVYGYRRLEVSGTSYGLIVMLILANAESNQQIQTVLADNPASATWPSRNISNSNIKVETIGSDDGAYGIKQIKVTVYKAGTLTGAYLGGIDGAYHAINDTFTANQSKTYTCPNSNGIKQLYAIFQ